MAHFHFPQEGGASKKEAFLCWPIKRAEYTSSEIEVETRKDLCGLGEALLICSRFQLPAAHGMCRRKIEPDLLCQFVLISSGKNGAAEVVVGITAEFAVVVLNAADQFVAPDHVIRTQQKAVALPPIVLFSSRCHCHF